MATITIPKVTEAHRRLERLVGAWSGEERLYPSPFDPLGGAATGRVRNQLALDGFAVVQDYERLKARAGMLDFLDLLRHARDLVRDDGAVRADLQTKLTHLFVDEFQDTDPLQAELLLLLAADDPRADDWRRVRALPGKLFLVGDPKQSIYRFRGADLEAYAQASQRVLAQGGEELFLQTNFRSRPGVIDAGCARVVHGPARSPSHDVATFER
jgi:superfamily I DNA/RNA helicase